MIILRSIVWYIHIAASTLLSIPLLFKMRKIKKTISPAEYGEKIVGRAKDWALKQIQWSGSHYHLSGMENLPEKGPVLYVANHQGVFDVGVFLAYMPFPKGFISKVEVLKIPLIPSWMIELKCIFMDRNNLRNSAAAITTGIEQLKNGHSMVIFPEGHRNWRNGPGDFKAGSFKLAVRAKVPIVPVTIYGTYKAMEANHMLIKPAEIQICVHPMLETANLTQEESLELPDRVKEIILSKLSELKNQS